MFQLGPRALGIIIPHGTAPSPWPLNLGCTPLPRSSLAKARATPNLQRNATLPKENAGLYFVRRANLQRLIIGLVSAPQLQLADLAARIGDHPIDQRTNRKRSVRVIGSTMESADGVGQKHNAASPLWGANSALRRGLLDELWVSAEVIARRARASAFMRESSEQPLRQQRGPTRSYRRFASTVTTWPSAVRAAGPSALKALRRRLLNTDHDESVTMVHIFGGYDDPGGSPLSHEYADSIRVLARPRKPLRRSLHRRPSQLADVFTAPRGISYRGVERDIFNEEGVPARTS